MMGMGGQGSGGVENCTFLEGVDQDTLQTVVEQSNDIRAESYERMTLERDVIAEDVKDSVEDQEQRRRSLRDELRSNLGSILMTGTLKRAPVNREQREQVDASEADEKSDNQPEQPTAKTATSSPEVSRIDRTRLLTEAAALLQHAEDKVAAAKPPEAKPSPDMPTSSEVTSSNIEKRPTTHQDTAEPIIHETITRLEQASDVQKAEIRIEQPLFVETTTAVSSHEPVPASSYEVLITHAEPQVPSVTLQETILYDRLALDSTDHENNEETVADEDTLPPAIIDITIEPTTGDSESLADMEDTDLTRDIERVTMEQQTSSEEPSVLESIPYDTVTIEQADELFTRIEALIVKEEGDEHSAIDIGENGPATAAEIQSEDQTETLSDDLSLSLAHLSESITTLHEMRQVQATEASTSILEIADEQSTVEPLTTVSAELTNTPENMPATDDAEAEPTQDQVIAEIRAAVADIYLVAYGQVDEEAVERLVTLLTSEDYSPPIKELIGEDGPQLHERGTHEQLQWFMANIRNLRYVSRDLHRFIGKFAASHIRPLEAAA